MRVDHDKREIVCSVGDLVYESTYRRIGVERGDGFRRMWIGQDIHTRRAEIRAAEDPHYRAEVQFVPQLVLIDLVSGDTKIVDTEFDVARVASALDRSLAQLIEDIESQHALRLAKRSFAASLAFPYDAMRPFQPEMISAVARAIE